MNRGCSKAASRDRNRRRHAVGALLAGLLAGCGPLQEFTPSADHLETVATPGTIPPPVVPPPLPPPPVPQPVQQTYTVVVSDVPVREVLFALARDAGLDIDVAGELPGRVTMNAIDQTLPQILDRISRQGDIRYTLADGTLLVSADTPMWRNYTVDYVNMSRTSEGEVAVATEIASTGGSVDSDSDSGSGGDGDQGNTSRTTVKSLSDNSFWVTLTANLRQIITGRAASQDDAESIDPVVVNPITGMVSVLASQAQHAQVQAWIDKLALNSKRQVLIEVTVVEVTLGDDYQAGVDWSRVSSNAGAGRDGISMIARMTGNNLTTPPVFTGTWNNLDPDGSGFAAAVSLLEQFGDAKVLSSPRILALNNQTALLKVVDERVYFNVTSETIESTGPGIAPRTIFTSEIRTVPVGFVMSVTPQINGNGNVSLNVRPTITRILGFAIDPAPRLAGIDFDNLVPEIHINEIESLLEVADGRTIVIGGLMQDEIDKRSDNVPGLSRLPGVGKLFSYRRETVKKSELVVFLRPTVIHSGIAEAVAQTDGDRHLAGAQVP